MEQIAVTNLTIMFTDLKGSTAMYHEVGDASAFGRVMESFQGSSEVCIHATRKYY
mgnify:CR=1 FL=1